MTSCDLNLSFSQACMSDHQRDDWPTEEYPAQNVYHSIAPDDHQEPGPLLWAFCITHVDVGRRGLCSRFRGNRDWVHLRTVSCDRFSTCWSLSLIYLQVCLCTNESIKRRAMLTLSGIAGSSWASNHPASIISLLSMRIFPPAYSAVKAIISEFGKGQG